MPNQPNRLLYAVLLSGLIFLLAAIFLVTNLLAEPPTADPVVIAVDNAAMDALANETEPDPVSNPPPETDTPTPQPTPTSLTTAGDKLAFPTTTPTASPFPAPTDTAAPMLPAVTAPLTKGLRIGDIAPDFTLGSNRAC